MFRRLRSCLLSPGDSHRINPLEPCALSPLTIRSLGPQPGLCWGLLCLHRPAVCQVWVHGTCICGGTWPRARGRGAHRRRRCRLQQDQQRVRAAPDLTAASRPIRLAECVAGGPPSCIPHGTATRAWSRCLSPPAPTSTPRPTAGTASGQIPRRRAVGCCSRHCGRSTALTWAALHGRTDAAAALIFAGAGAGAICNGAVARETEENVARRHGKSAEYAEAVRKVKRMRGPRRFRPGRVRRGWRPSMH